MIKKLLLTIACSSFGISSFASIQETSPLKKAIELIQSGNTQEGYDLLESIPTKSSDFVFALEELQKIHYQNEQWDRFFGYSTYYRTMTLNSKNKINSKLISLEILALGKQCYWEQASSIATYGMSVAKEQKDTNTFNEIEHAFSVLKLQKSFPKLRQAKNGANIQQPIFTNKPTWPIQFSSIQHVPHPRALRVKLENKCNFSN